MRRDSLLLAGCLTAVILTSSALADKPAAPGETSSPLAQLKPRWQVGLGWIVETTSHSAHAAVDPAQLPPPRTTSWQFTVKKVEKIAGRDCFRVEVVPVDDSTATPRVFWADQQTMMLRRVQSPFLGQGKGNTFTETYNSPEDQPAPILGPLSSLPLDFPVFTSSKSRGAAPDGTFTYTPVSGLGEARGVGGTRFAVDIKQNVTAAPDKDVKELVHKELSRGLKPKTGVEVRLETAERKVRQVWQPGMPWPSFSDNGDTVSRLIKVIPPGTP